MYPECKCALCGVQWVQATLLMRAQRASFSAFQLPPSHLSSSSRHCQKAPLAPGSKLATMMCAAISNLDNRRQRRYTNRLRACTMNFEHIIKARTCYREPLAMTGSASENLVA
ncbi:unnamed protein product [Prorocentrum cordatum]|uniref:Uncharacterized protein n=1 Tax=Prorocentrum cordatum TaxID=2364126 RepID=A0ABN9THQ0_9DINO|nr:unnamed protein product [Polarella glacialis]